MFRIPKPSMPCTTATTMAKQSKQVQGCLYTPYECTQPCLEDYSYCTKHILEDSNAPYKQCAFVYNTNGRKCQNPAPKLDRRDISYVFIYFIRANSLEFVIVERLKYYAGYLKNLGTLSL